MAKKQSSSLNYGPDTALILGERDVRRAQAALTLAPGRGIVEGVGVIQTMLSQKAKAQQEANKKDSDDHQDWLETLEDPSSVYQLTNKKDKETSLNWLRNKRQQYLNAKKLYKQTGNYEYEDQANMFGSQINNFVSQTSSYNETQAEYADATHHFGKANGSNAPKHIYQGDRTMVIDDNGDINFSIINPEYLQKGGDGSKLVSYNKVGQKWNVRNQTAETFISDKVEGIYNEAAIKGPTKYTFNRQKTFTDFYSHLADRDKYGPENSMVLAETNIAGDDAFVNYSTDGLGKGLNFSQLWESGLLDKKFYEGFTSTGKDPKTGNSTYDNSWMFDEKNSDQLNRSLAEFYTDVAADRDYDGNEEYKFVQKNLTEQELEDLENKERMKKEVSKEYEKTKSRTPTQLEVDRQRVLDRYDDALEGKDLKAYPNKLQTREEMISFYVNEIDPSATVVYYTDEEAKERNLNRGAGYYKRIDQDDPMTDELETYYLEYIAPEFSRGLLGSLYKKR